MISLRTDQKILAGIAFLAAAVYLLFPLTPGSFAFIGIKGSCCIFLAALVWRSDLHRKTRSLLIVALLCSSLGDIFLAVRSTNYFVQGLGAFLIGHLLYIAVFVRAKTTGSLTRARQILVGGAIIGALIMIALLWPVLGELKMPVVIYISVITLMVMSVIYSTYPAPLAIFGAFSFMFSDSLIAINKFLVPFDLSSPLIWVSYMAAQFALTFAVLQGTKKAS